MTEMERVWERVKLSASQHAASATLVSMADARYIVDSICDDESHKRPPGAAIDYLAGELVRLTLEATFRGVSCDGEATPT